MNPEKPIRGQVEFTKDTAPIAVSLRAITDNKTRGRLRAAATVDAIRTSLTRWVDDKGWTYEFENPPRVTISEKDIGRAAATVDLKVWDASNTLIFRDRIHAWDGFSVLVPDGTQRQETLLTGEISLIDNFREDSVEAARSDLEHTVRVVTKNGPWVKTHPGTVDTFYGLAGDGYVGSNSGTYATARTGGILGSNTTSILVGQWPSYDCNEGFCGFDTSSIPDTNTISQADLSLWLLTDGSATDFTVQVRPKTWTPTLATADWVSGADLGALTLLATLASSGIGATGAYKTFTENGTNLQSAISLTGNSEFILNSDRHEAGTIPTAFEYLIFQDANNAGTTQDPKLVVTHAPPNTAPTITTGPTTTYASGTATTPTVTWGVTFTATDAEQTGADALTYYIRTSSTFGAGTQVATGTCTSGTSKVVTGLTYNAPGVNEGTQTLYLHIYDGALNTVTASSFTLVRRFIRSTEGTGGTLSGALSRAPIYGKALAGAISSISGALYRIVNKALSGTSGSLSGVLSRIVNKALSGAPSSLSASLTRVTMKSFSGVAGVLSGALSAGKTTALAIDGAISAISGTLTAGAVYAKALAGELSSILGNASRITFKGLSGSSGAVSGALSSTMIFAQVLAGEIVTLTGSIVRSISKSLSGTLVGSGVLTTASSFFRSVSGSLSSLTGEFSFKSIIKRAKMKGGSVVRSVISGGSRKLR